MPNFLYGEEKKLDSGMTELPIFNKSGEKMAYIQFKAKEIGGKHLIEIEQVYTDPRFRGLGYASMLILKIFAKAITENNDIRMQIQPGSENFYQKFFRQFFNVKKLTLYGENPSALGSKIKDGVSLDIPAQQLLQHYKTEEHNRDMERIIGKKK